MIQTCPYLYSSNFISNVKQARNLKICDRILACFTCGVKLLATVKGTLSNIFILVKRDLLCINHGENRDRCVLNHCVQTEMGKKYCKLYAF